MTGLAELMEETTSAANECQGSSEWAPFRSAARQDETRARRRLTGLGVLASLLLFSGVTVAVAGAQATLVERYGVSEETLLMAAWMVQGAAALLCFVLAVRWLRS